MTWLLLLTVLAAALRFYALDRPPLWGDEAMTWTRICGTYPQLLEVLRLDGFTPLHYQLLWWITHGLPIGFPGGWTIHPVPGGIQPTPLVLRFVPAICGVLMVPAMYALAVQLAPRRVAVLAAALACTSAYLLAYSRDAKMYMPAWLFIALHVACLLWWIRLRHHRRWSRPAWYLWVATGLGMVGLHATTAVVLAIDALIWLSTRRRGAPLRWIAEALVFTAGIGLPLLALAGYYGLGEPGDWYHVPGFNRWNLTNPPTAGATGLPQGGLAWVEGYNAGRGFGEHVRYTFSAFLHDWEWPRPEDASRVDRRIRLALMGATFAIGLATVLGLAMPPRRARQLGALKLATRGRRAFWLLAWIALPLWTWWLLSRGEQPTHVPRWLCVAGFVWLGGNVVAILRLRSPAARLARAWQTTWPPLAVALLLVAITLLVSAAPRGDGPSLWMPRYLGFIWPALAAALVLLLDRLRWRPLRWGAFALLLATNLAQYAAMIHAGTEPPSDRFALDMHAAGEQPGRVVLLMNLSPPKPGEGPVGFGAPGTGYPASFPTIYYAALAAADDWTPAQVRGFQLPLMKYVGPRLSASGLGRQALLERLTVAARQPQAERIILWTQAPADPADFDEAIGEHWRRFSHERFVVRDRWTWQRFDELHRFEFHRASAPPLPTSH